MRFPSAKCSFKLKSYVKTLTEAHSRRRTEHKQKIVCQVLLPIKDCTILLSMLADMWGGENRRKLTFKDSQSLSSLDYSLLFFIG